MVTWLKKISYSIVTKCIAIIMLCLAVVGIAVSGIDFVQGIQHEAYEDSYVETNDFLWDIAVPKAGYVRDWIVRYTDEDIFNPDKVDIKTYEPNYAAEYRKIKDKGLSEADYSKEIANLEKRIRNEVIRDRKLHFAKIQQELIDKPMNLDFLAIDLTTGKYITNIEGYDPTKRSATIEELRNRPSCLVGDETTIRHDSELYTEMQGYYVSGKVVENTNKPYEIYVAPKDELVVEDEIYAKSSAFNTIKYQFNEAFELGGVCIAIIIVSIIYLTVVTGKVVGKKGVSLRGVDRIPFEVQGAFLLIAATISMLIGSYLVNLILYNRFSDYYSVMQNALIGVLIIDALIGLTCYLSIVRNLKNKSFWNNTVLGKVYGVCVGTMLNEKRLPIGIIVCFGGYLMINAVLGFILLTSYSFFFILALMGGVVFNGVVLILLFKIANDFRMIGQGVGRIEGGELSYKINLSHTLPALKNVANKINNIGEGLSNSIDQTLRSEKMKTELITNVSHDLKTPLTSIISYIDLLKGEDIPNEIAREYIEVISERGERLKVLIQDLVEASKAATGNVAVNLETIELAQFVQQAVGEYTDRLEANSITIVMHEESNIQVEADGRHMWRVVDNLLSNVVKYAMPHTRVYIDICEKDQVGILTIKNISSEQLTGKENILTERFVRGDEARSTEGSGLGLSIAQSLSELQGGKLSIEVDGDLFKATVQIPLATKGE